MTLKELELNFICTNG